MYWFKKLPERGGCNDDDDVTIIFEGDCEFDSLVKFVGHSFLSSEIPDQPEPVDLDVNWNRL